MTEPANGAERGDGVRALVKKVAAQGTDYRTYHPDLFGEDGRVDEANASRVAGWGHGIIPEWMVALIKKKLRATGRDAKWLAARIGISPNHYRNVMGAAKKAREGKPNINGLSPNPAEELRHWLLEPTPVLELPTTSSEPPPTPAPCPIEAPAAPENIQGARYPENQDPESAKPSADDCERTFVDRLVAQVEMTHSVDLPAARRMVEERWREEQRAADRAAIANTLKWAKRDPLGQAFELGPDSTDCHTLAHWETRKIEPSDFLLGSIFTTTTRAELAADTGLGKTHLGFGWAFAMAAGQDFCQWKARRPARVLYVDGEMSAGLVQQRLRDEAARAGQRPKGLHVLCREDVPEMPPLDAEDGSGWRWLIRYIERIGGNDFLILDNAMSLTQGDLKDELTWRPVIDGMREMTRRQVGVLMIHHTGHDASRGYGAKTRQWQLDLVMLGEKVPEDGADIAFRLSFPKARQRRPENRADFSDTVLRLRDDRWSHEGAPPRSGKGRSGRQPDYAKILLERAIAEADDVHVPGMHKGIRGIRSTLWERYCETYDLADSGAEPASVKTAFRRAKKKLQNQGKIATKSGYVWIP